MKRSRWLYWSVAVLCLSGTACDDSGSPDGDEQVRLLAETFDRPAVTISVGETVRWVNGGNVLHNVTPDNLTQPGVWQTFSLDDNGEARSHTFNTAGTFNYSCTLHDGMDGTITVTQ
jgi:plastocyanin